jgi:hypothetical protein
VKRVAKPKNVYSIVYLVIEQNYVQDLLPFLFYNKIKQKEQFIMFAKLIKNNLPWACQQILGTEKGKLAYPYVQAVFDLFTTGNHDPLNAIGVILNAIGMKVPDLTDL